MHVVHFFADCLSINYTHEHTHTRKKTHFYMKDTSFILNDFLELYRLKRFLNKFKS